MSESCCFPSDTQAEQECAALYMRAHYTDSYAASASRLLSTERDSLRPYLPGANECDMHALSALDFEGPLASW